MFPEPQKIEEKSKSIFITFENTTLLWFSFVFPHELLMSFLSILQLHILAYTLALLWLVFILNAVII